MEIPQESSIVDPLWTQLKKNIDLPKIQNPAILFAFRKQMLNRMPMACEKNSRKERKEQQKSDTSSLLGGKKY